VPAGIVQAIPAFLTIAVMPMTYSVAYGVIAGLVTYIIINGASRLIDLCHRLFTTVSSAVLRRPHQRKVHHLGATIPDYCVHVSALTKAK
jgi:xanthine/uracil/vitamin C permease (AzgA family)